MACAAYLYGPCKPDPKVCGRDGRGVWVGRGERAPPMPAAKLHCANQLTIPHTLPDPPNRPPPQEPLSLPFLKTYIAFANQASDY